MKLTSFSRTGYLLAACLGLTMVSSLSAQPYGWFDSMSPSGTDVTVTTTISGNGWAADDVYGAPVQRIEIRVDGNTVLNATLGDDRSDVAAVFGRSDFTYSGFHFSYSAGNLSTGSHTFSAVAFNPAGQSSQLGNTFSVNVLANRAPSTGISVDGHSPGDTITRPYGGSTQVTVRYTASDPDGNLQGIRYNIWNATTGYFNNGSGGFVGTGGNSGEVDQTVNLDSDGDWYFWTDAQDTMNAYASTGDWTNGFHIVVNQAPAPNHQPVVNWVTASPSELAPGETVRLTANVSDQDNDLSEVYFYVNGPPYYGWQLVNVAGVSGGNAQPSFDYTVPGDAQTGTWLVTARVHDSNNAWDVDDTNADRTSFAVKKHPSVSSADSSVTVNQPFTPPYTGPDGGNWAFCINGQTNWDSVHSGTLLPPNNTPSPTWTPTQTGTYVFSVARLEDNDYFEAGAYNYTLTVNPAPKSSQATVYISPSSTSVTQGGSITFNASGGSGSGAYQWGGDAGGSGSNTTVTFNTTGTRTVTVYRQGDASYNDSNTATATITVNPAPPPPPPPPTITSSLSASGTVGQAFTYWITASNSPTGYNATGLPPGLSVNTSNGLISGTPSSAGTYNVDISASNGGGTGHATLTITISASINFNLKIHRPN